MRRIATGCQLASWYYSVVCVYDAWLQRKVWRRRMRDNEDWLWPVGTYMAEITSVAAPRLGLLVGDDVASLRQQYGARRFINAHCMQDAVDAGAIIKSTEERMVEEMILEMWRKGYWPVKPLAVRWYRYTA